MIRQWLGHGLSHASHGKMDGHSLNLMEGENVKCLANTGLLVCLDSAWN